MVELQQPEGEPQFFPLVPVAVEVLKQAGLTEGGSRPVYAKARRGEIRSIKVGRRWLTCLPWLQEYVDGLSQ